MLKSKISRRTQLLNYLPMAPPSVKKTPKRLKFQQNKGLLETLVNIHIPCSESALNASQRECAELSSILIERDAAIYRKMKISQMKDAEIRNLKTENAKLKAKNQELEKRL